MHTSMIKLNSPMVGGPTATGHVMAAWLVDVSLHDIVLVWEVKGKESPLVSPYDQQTYQQHQKEPALGSIHQWMACHLRSRSGGWRA